MFLSPPVQPYLCPIQSRQNFPLLLFCFSMSIDHFRVTFGYLLPLCQNESVRHHSYENVFHSQVQFHANNTYFYFLSFTRELVLKQSHMVTRVNPQCQFPNSHYHLYLVDNWSACRLFYLSLQHRADGTQPDRNSCPGFQFGINHPAISR